MINIAEVFIGTRALGPGLRSVIWVQGCPFHCNGCYSPQWIPNKAANFYTPQELAKLVLSRPDIEGITISGGEPFYQSDGLVEFLKIIKDQSTVNIICFSGYTYPTLLAHPKASVQTMLRLIDVLIDGPYICEKEINKGLRGSSNQHMYHLTTNLIHHDLAQKERVNEIHLFRNEILAVGIPTKEIKSLMGFHQNSHLQKGVSK